MMTDDTYAAYQFYTLLFISGCLHVCIHYLIEEKKKKTNVILYLGGKISPPTTYVNITQWCEGDLSESVRRSRKLIFLVALEILGALFV